jgi:energy-coupling factor transport system ATP-binding protein
VAEPYEGATMSVVATSRSASTLSYEGFGYRYPDGGWALRDLTLEIAAGEIVVACGRSGSGKSTFLRSVSGLVPHHFGGEAEGEARICGRDLRISGAGDLAACCGTVLQDPETQRVMGSVRGEIAFPLENLGFTSSEIAVAVEETALALGIDHLLDRSSDELSGGELQRVMLAAAIAPRPEVVVLDEPTSQLDPVVAEELLSCLRRLNADRGTTIVVAEHRIDHILEIADRVIAFDDGALAIDAPPAEFLAEAADHPGLEWLLTPAAELFSRSGIAPLPVGLKEARARLAEEPLPNRTPPEVAAASATAEVALRFAGVAHSYPSSNRPALDGVDLTITRGEAVVLLGANGAGKSTLLRAARGIIRPDRGSVERAGEIALLLQNPNDYLIHERVADEAPVAALKKFGIEHLADRDPRDLSGGERQRVALAIVMQDEPVALLLDEPTRGMDRIRKRDLARHLQLLQANGVAVIVATHDVEFAAQFADRALLLGSGRLIADAPASELLGSGWHFATDVAKLLPGTGALTPAQGAMLLTGERA